MLNIPSHKGNANKNPLRFYLTPIRMAIIMNTNKCWKKCGEIESLIHCWWKCKLVQPHWKTVWRFLKKLKIELPYDPEIPLLGIYPKEYKSGYNKSTCTAMFLQNYSQYLSYGNSQNDPLLMNESRKCGIYIQWNFIHPQR
jgi:hypothetical protein